MTNFQLPIGNVNKVRLLSGNSNEYSKRCVDSSHTYNFYYLYAFILILILYSHYSYSKFEVHIVLILNNTHDVVESELSMNRHLEESQNKYDSHTNTIILTRRLCVYFACCLGLLFFFFFFL